MQVNEIKPTHKGKISRRIGRGGKRGTFSGKGVKGQNSRAGRKKMPMIREIIKRYPKLRGYKYGGIPKLLIAVNLDLLENKFEAGETVTPEILLKKGVIRRIGGKAPNVKVLGTGKLTKSLSFERCKISATAKTAIEKAGGKIK